MQHWDYVLLLISGFLAGVVNSLAGGGSLISYPLLLALGVAPIIANATSSLVVWPSALSSAYGYRKHILKLPNYFYFLLIPALVGGIIGAVLLQHTSNHSFEFIVPWFIAFAVILLAVQPKVHSWIYKKSDKKNINKYNRMSFIIISIAMFGVSIYGGYFGAGIGIIILAFLGLTKLTDIQEMNGLKNVVGSFINLAASSYFIFYKLIDWHVVPVMIIGGIFGGLVGSSYGSKLPSKVVRYMVIGIGLVVAVVLFVKR